MILWAENRPEWIAAFWGCLLNGVVVVPVDYRASVELLERIQVIVQARAVVAGDQVAQQSDYWRINKLQWNFVQDCARFAKTNSAQLCEILFTSGATAEPKGVTITHANLLANIVPVETEIRKHRKWSVPFAPIRFLNLLPLSHLFGQSMATFIPPTLPGIVVFMTGFAPAEIIHQIASRRISVLVSVPRILEVLREYVVQRIPEAAEAPAPGANWVRRWWQYRRVHNLFGWKFWSFIVGAAPLEPALEEFWSKLGFVVVQGYGLTETAPIVTLNHPFHTSKGSVGKPIGGVEVQIAADGEILVRGANVTQGYYGEGTETSAFVDGWFHTGDIGGQDADGGVFIRGRKKEMIVTPEGLNVFPEDVERALNGMAGVKESAVVGTGRVHAVLVLEPGVDGGGVVERANMALEAHQRIRDWSQWPEERLPRTEGTQKLKRTAIREFVEGREPARLTGPNGSEELLPEYGDEMPLAQIGLGSLDRVELMARVERRGAASVDDTAFAQAKTVGELRRLARDAGSHAPVRQIAFPAWNRSWWARGLRRIALPLVLLPLLRIFVWLRVSGRERLPVDQAEPVLLAVNHQSVFDVPAVLAALPGRWRYQVAPAMGMEWFRPHFHPEGYGWWARFGNNLQYYLVCLFFHAFPIPQQEAGAREALRYAGELVSGGTSVLLFPEGVRTQAGEIAPFQAGVGLMAARLRVRVIPVRIEGLERVLHQTWKWPRPGRVRVKFGAPLKFSGTDYRAIASEVETAMRAL